MALTKANRNPSRGDRSFTVRPWWISIAIAVGFLAFRSGVLDQPPVWDGAMGMTPAAITLESLDFDIVGLLDMPDYGQGGPNVHALSLATWFVAVSIRLFGSYQAALPALHLVSFALVGLLGAGVFRAVRGATSSTALALAAAVVTVVFPPIVVQASDVYLDLPLAVALTWSFVYLFESRPGPAIAFFTLAAAIKPSALIAVPSVAYFLWKTEVDKRGKNIPLLLIPVSVAMAPLVIDASLQSSSYGSLDNASLTFLASIAFLRRMPVLIIVVMILVILPIIAAIFGRAYGRSWAMLISTWLFPISFVYFFSLNPLLTKGVTAIPRYTTMFLPLVVVGLCVGIALVATKRVAMFSCVVLGCVFVLNLHGALEPASSNAFWIAERSLVYEDKLAVQQTAFERFAELATEMPAFYDHFAHYRIEYPEMGWVENHIPPGHNLNTPPRMSGEDLPTLPDEFVMLIEGNWLGGLELQEISYNARNNPEYSIDVKEIARGEFSSQIVVVRRTP